jgi:hypothetical protein
VTEKDYTVQSTVTTIMNKTIQGDLNMQKKVEEAVSMEGKESIRSMNIYWLNRIMRG